jgi:sensor histidine kinase YesM
LAEATLYIRNSGLLRRRWLYHTLFWTLYFGLTVVLYLSLREKLRAGAYIMIALQIVVQAGFCYLNFYVLMPRLLFTRKYALYILSLIGIFSLCPLIVGVADYIYMLDFEDTPKDKLHIITFGGWIIGIITFLYTVGLATGIKFVKDTIVNQQLQKEREKHYLETELKFLRAQIQPHFFFNTLNNIYSLTLKKSDQAPEIILKLSDLMSYMLYESTAPLVPLNKEIDYLHNYLDVEQLRFGNRLTISFNIEGDTTGIQIPPMILILFLENSFKHGVKNNISNILLTIRLRVESDQLLFHVENPISEEEKDPNAKGIGLSNVRRRLDLLYGHRHTLDIRETEGRFIVTLKMPLC